jgi:hypothetical protein
LLQYILPATFDSLKQASDSRTEDLSITHG